LRCFARLTGGFAFTGFLPVIQPFVIVLIALGVIAVTSGPHPWTASPVRHRDYGLRHTA